MHTAVHDSHETQTKTCQLVRAPKGMYKTPFGRKLFCFLWLLRVDGNRCARAAVRDSQKTQSKLLNLCALQRPYTKARSDKF